MVMVFLCRGYLYQSAGPFYFYAGQQMGYCSHPGYLQKLFPEGLYFELDHQDHQHPYDFGHSRWHFSFDPIYKI
jgi:hypothetical protein